MGKTVVNRAGPRLLLQDRHPRGLAKCRFELILRDLRYLLEDVQTELRPDHCGDGKDSIGRFGEAAQPFADDVAQSFRDAGLRIAIVGPNPLTPSRTTKPSSTR
jgi:hypothetical protein